MMSLNKNSSLKDSQEQTSVRFNEQNLFEVVSGLRLNSHKILSLAFFSFPPVVRLTTRRMQVSSRKRKTRERRSRNICFARCFQCTLRRLDRNDKTGENHIARAPLSASRAALVAVVVVGSFIFMNMLLNWKPKRRWFLRTSGWKRNLVKIVILQMGRLLLAHARFPLRALVCAPRRVIYLECNS